MDKEHNWKVGEVVKLPEQTTVIKQGISNVYEHVIRSKYICVREAAEGKQGILVKVLGKIPAHDIDIVGGEPFCKDVRDELFAGDHFSSFRYPLTIELVEALNYIRHNQELKKLFDKEGMHVNPDSTFWVRETARNLMFQKKPQYYDAKSGSISIAQDDHLHYRLSIVHFPNSH